MIERSTQLYYILPGFQNQLRTQVSRHEFPDLNTHYTGYRKKLWGILGVKFHAGDNLVDWRNNLGVRHLSLHFVPTSKLLKSDDNDIQLLYI
jgi:hypothetical protein